VRIEFDRAVFDNKGGSRTTTPTEAEPYDAFFREFDSARPRAEAHTARSHVAALVPNNHPAFKGEPAA
jgi:hypothetical protein